MIKVKEILEKKGTEVVSVSPDTLVFDALKLMALKDIGALIVQDNDKLVGMFSERDYARKVILRGKSSKETFVSEFMTKRIYTCSPESTSRECLTLMTEKRVRHVPVMDNGNLSGIISIGDVVNMIILDQKHTIKHLENYITGG
ncbi:MAG: CBS domain-containing protein [Prolixibacteraceae bacterium]|nr:CBS domain-containing protein [Prolixibacteraceae bacterium]